jgi:DNA-binding transcriptional LysR family regulator
MPYLDSIRVFVRTVELGSITAGGRDLRLTPAVASNRIRELENRLGIRLFNRTTRKIAPTEVGRLFYDHAKEIIDALDKAEAAVAEYSQHPRGSIKVLSPLGLARRVVAPLVPEFNDLYPDLAIQLRLSDRKVDIFDERVDVAIVLGTPEDSSLKARKIMDCPRVLCAAPIYLDHFGTPEKPEDLVEDGHHCLLLRFPGTQEYFWTLQTKNGPTRFNVRGPYDADEGDVLTEWALAGRGIVNKPYFEVASHIRSGALVTVLEDTPPPPVALACLYPHRRLLDPKIRLFVDFMIRKCKARVEGMMKGTETPAA